MGCVFHQVNGTHCGGHIKNSKGNGSLSENTVMESEVTQRIQNDLPGEKGATAAAAAAASPGTLLEIQILAFHSRPTEPEITVVGVGESTWLCVF